MPEKELLQCLKKVLQNQLGLNVFYKEIAGLFYITRDLPNKLVLVGECSVIAQFFKELNFDLFAVKSTAIIKQMKLLDHARPRPFKGWPAANIT